MHPSSLALRAPGSMMHRPVTMQAYSATSVDSPEGLTVLSLSGLVPSRCRTGPPQQIHRTQSLLSSANSRGSLADGLHAHGLAALSLTPSPPFPQVRKALSPRTKMVHIESPSNPLMMVPPPHPPTKRLPLGSLLPDTKHSIA